MAPFIMCGTCRSEYENPLDRRFHAQPVACTECGPMYSLSGSNGVAVNGNTAVLAETVRLLELGAVVAIKGTGGFHLACDPFNHDAVSSLRRGKQRDGKPLAVMVRDIETLRQFAEVSTAEATLLQSIVRPIVLLKGGAAMSHGVSNHLPTLGAMLPSMPFHHLLFEKTRLPALVMTSGNISDEPIIIENSSAIRVFGGFCDGVVTYNRDIHNRVDDSVCTVFGDRIQILRRSRGFAPSPVALPFSVDDIAATGAELKCCFALGKGSRAIISQHIGDLKNSETLAFYEEAWDRLCTLFRVKPALIAHDAHPDYLSTRFAAAAGVPLVAVQHHHAHIAACCAEHGISDRVIGVAMDGTGYGTDGAVWGGEFLIADLRGFERFTHLRYVGMPGGDAAAREPWRMAAAYLHDAYGLAFYDRCRDLMPEISRERLELIDASISKGINCPPTSSAGRLFDAVGVLCGGITVQTFEAEAAMRLEAHCTTPISEAPYDWLSDATIDLRPVVRHIVDDVLNRVPLRTVSGRFHATIVDVIVRTCEKMRDATGITTVVLSGGCFQNRCIFMNAVRVLTEHKFIAVTHQQIPCNDGGIALGQLAVAAHASAG
jgi:hydrogenase maturation protein HypF